MISAKPLSADGAEGRLSQIREGQSRLRPPVEVGGDVEMASPPANNDFTTMAELERMGAVIVEDHSFRNLMCAFGALAVTGVGLLVSTGVETDAMEPRLFAGLGFVGAALALVMAAVCAADAN